MFWLFSGIFLGWAIGTNDAANVFGNAVSSRMLKFRDAAILGAIFVVIGALLKGTAGIHTLSALSAQTLRSAIYVSLASAITITIMNSFKLPISTSQSLVGAIIGQSLLSGSLNYSVLTKILSSWVGTPILAFFLSILIYYFFKLLFNKIDYNFIFLDAYIKYGFIITGCYGAYALGANNVANAVGIFKGLTAFSDLQLAFLGGLSIAAGILTFSRRVMFTVGRNLLEMNSFSSLLAVISCSVTVHYFAHIGVPVSASQALVGAVLGVGTMKGLSTLKWKLLASISFAWILAPVVGGLISYLLNFIFH